MIPVYFNFSAKCSNFEATSKWPKSLPAIPHKGDFVSDGGGITLKVDRVTFYGNEVAIHLKPENRE